MLISQTKFSELFLNSFYHSHLSFFVKEKIRQRNATKKAVLLKNCLVALNAKNEILIRGLFFC